MKRVKLIVAILVLFMGGNMAYAGQFGAMEPVSEYGKISLGIGYFYYSDKLEPKDTEGTWISWKKSKVTQNQAYLQLGCGLFPKHEIYLRVGGADIKVPDAFLTSADSPDIAGFKDKFKDSLKPFGTIGFKGGYNFAPPFGIGYFVNTSLGSNYKDKTAGTYLGFSATQEMKIKRPWEVNLGVGLQGKIGEVILYAGPVVYWARSKVEWEGAIPGVGNISDSTTYKEKNNLGGFAGLRLPLGKGFNIEVESQLKSRFSAGGSLVYSF
jgi:hypothetical protein